MFQFPAAPTVGQTYTPSAGITFRWNGTAWFLIAGSGAFISQADGDLRYAQLANVPGRNAIINGSMMIWQRGTSFVAVPSATVVADRWKHIQIGTGIFTVIRALGPLPHLYSLQYNVTTADAAMAAADFYALRTVIEGYDFAPLRGTPLTLSFWVQSSVIGIYGLTLQNSGNDRMYTTTYTINVANTWEYKTINIPASDLTGTWDYTNGFGLGVVFGLGCGSDYYSPTLNAWFTPSGGSPKLPATQVTFPATNGNNFFLTGVQLEKGGVASVFESLPVEVVLAKCQRYFEKSYDYATVPGTATFVGSTVAPQMASPGAGNSYINPQYKASKRIIPTVTLYSPQTGITGRFADNTAADVAAVVLSGNGENSISARNSAAGAAVPMFAHWTANAEF